MEFCKFEAGWLIGSPVPTAGVVEDEPVITVFDTGLLSRDKGLETLDRPWHRGSGIGTFLPYVTHMSCFEIILLAAELKGCRYMIRNSYLLETSPLRPM